MPSAASSNTPSRAPGLPYYHPHTFRHTLARHGEKMRLTPEEWQAYSQNFGHSNPMTTFTSYGQVPQYRQAEILNQLTEPRDPSGFDEHRRPQQ